MKTATTYEDWLSAARQLDELRGYKEWQQNVDSFDPHWFHTRLSQLKSLRQSNDARKIIPHLRADLHRGVGGVWNPKLHVYTTGSKKIVEEYLQLVEDTLHTVLDSSALSLREKHDFFSRLTSAYGRSALLLCGGATFGIYHVGVIKALWKKNLLPRIITGTNTGAIIAAITCCTLDSDMDDLLEFRNQAMFEIFAKKEEKKKEEAGAEPTHPAWMRRVKRFVEDGVLMDVNVLKEFLQNAIGDITFLEAYERTGRVLNIAVSRVVNMQQGKAYWTMNFLTAPHIVVWSAACASCSTPGVYADVQLMAKNGDGKVEAYQPAALKWGTFTVTTLEQATVTRIAELFNINYFIVSQTNLTVVPRAQGHGDESFWRRLLTFWTEVGRYRCQQLAELSFVRKLGVLPSFFAKRFEGDVEIFPCASLSDTTSLLANPTLEVVLRCCLRAEQATWPKLSMISSLCGIERTLDICTRTARTKLLEFNALKLSNTPPALPSPPNRPHATTDIVSFPSQ
eukprot:TRINITY_DN21750_c0_g1_i1.p1 TRINITY_DN21750_c0_g1~~TRINITY_DN21750_c0_g1_i1.p1  ORF type:complete len:573 (-),score=38.85 TRINITY_DN21750_c0_g1_i1:1946-3475(-)